MTNRTWIGGGNNQASNGSDWSPTGAPQPGDNLSMGSNVPSQETMNVSGIDLSSDALGLFGNDTVNISHGASVVATVPAGGGAASINIKDDDNLSLQVGSPGGNAAAPVSGTVNLAANSHWIGSFNVVAGINAANAAALQVNAGAKASFVDNGLSFVHGIGAHAVIDANVSGTTIVRVTDGGALEFGGSVGSGQSVILSGPSLLQIDHPTQFAGSANLIGGEIDLMGLATADSYSYQNSVLSIFGGGNVIDTLKLTDSTPNGFEVEKTAGSVNVLAYADASHTVVGTALPLHA